MTRIKGRIVSEIVHVKKFLNSISGDLYLSELKDESFQIKLLFPGTWLRHYLPANWGVLSFSPFAFLRQTMSVISLLLHLPSSLQKITLRDGQVISTTEETRS